jgi:hypothetical protein
MNTENIFLHKILQRCSQEVFATGFSNFPKALEFFTLKYLASSGKFANLTNLEGHGYQEDKVKQKKLTRSPVVVIIYGSHNFKV